MNKKDMVPVIILVALLPLWWFIDRTFLADKMPAYKPQPAPIEQTTPPTTGPDNTELSATTSANEKLAEAIETEIPAEEKIEILSNDKIVLELSSIGAGIKSAELIERDKDGNIAFPEENTPDSEPVIIRFADANALAYQGIEEIGATKSFLITKNDANNVTFSKSLSNGTIFQRRVTLGDGYLLTVRDRFINNSETPWSLPKNRLMTGAMTNPVGMKATKGVSILGVDSYSSNKELKYWGKKLNKLYKRADKASSIDSTPEGMENLPLDWVATKNKFFVQIINPTEATGTLSVLSTRDMNEKQILPTTIAASLNFNGEIIDAGKTFERSFCFFIGPKQHSILKAAGSDMEKVMEFETVGFWSFMNWLMEPSRNALLWTLNKFYSIIPNYGIAIILLTLLVRILFWPLTHKSTDSMRRMQELQPEIKALQKKYKETPQRLQQETMKLYKEKKVNPMGGCLPMVIQIPVFIALFTVLRNAIELRFSGFLWIADLSQPENLFAGSIPFIGSLNILPLLMSLSMIFQQKLSSPGTAATPEQQQQQKMMMFMMPIMMLFFFYSMPSGLVLYWTTSNLLMIAQTVLRNAKKKQASA